ncbi:MAG TPA: hypothetical protein VK453_13160 [Micromonosporaceae bacterium]|nr:hypothetical protein [Micromonosporaceae bacterium]
MDSQLITAAAAILGAATGMSGGIFAARENSVPGDQINAPACRTTGFAGRAAEITSHGYAIDGRVWNLTAGC